MNGVKCVVANSDEQRVVFLEPHGVQYTQRDAWLSRRRSGIGGSDSSTVLGVGYGSQYSLWCAKRGLTGDSPQREAMEFGNLLEPIVLRVLADRTGRTVCAPPKPHFLMQSRRNDFQFFSPDGFQFDADRGWGLVQAKTANYRADWREAPPLSYQVQLQHELAVSELSWGSLACVIGGQRFAYFDVERDEEFAEYLTSIERKFMRSVREDTPPPIDGSQSCSDAIARAYPTCNGDTITLPERFASVDRELEDAKAKIATLATRKRALENQLREKMGHNTTAVLPDGSTYTLRDVTRKEHIVPASSYRRLTRNVKDKS